MSWIQDTRKAQAAISDKGMINGSGVVTTRRSAYGSYATHPSKFMQVLHGNFMWGEIAPDPLLVRTLQPILLWAMPELASTLDIHARVIGYPEIETKDSAFKNDFEQWAKEFAWKGESTYAYDKMKGLAGYIYTLVMNTMTYGQSFATAMDAKGQQIQRLSQPIDFIRLHESCRFNYMQTQPDVYELTHEHGGTIDMPVPETPGTRQPIRFRTDLNYPYWGLPILYGVERAATAALLSGEAVKAHNSRVANPSTILVASFDPNMGGASDDIQMVRHSNAQWDAKMGTMRDAYVTQQNNQNRSGQPWNAFEFHSGGKVEFIEHVMGKDMKPAFSYKDEVLPLVASAVIGAYGVPEFVGIQTVSGGGIGSDQYTQMTARSEGFGLGCRKIIQSHVEWLMANAFLRNSRRIPKYEMEWDGLCITSEKGRAEVEKIQAEAAKYNAETAQMIAEGAGIAAVNAWLKSIDSEYLYPETEPLPPMPDDGEDL